MQIFERLAEWKAEFEQGWLAHLRSTGAYNFDLYKYAVNSTPLPPTPGLDLSQSRLMFISTAGGYIRGEQEPFADTNDYGDYTIRRLPSSTPFAALDYAHTHYDQTAVRSDPQVLLPLRHLETLVETGVIGELAPSLVSFMGYQPNVGRVVEEMIPQIVAVAQAEAINAALLVPA